jgi:hypothetical protein
MLYTSVFYMYIARGVEAQGVDENLQMAQSVDVKVVGEPFDPALRDLRIDRAAARVS